MSVMTCHRFCFLTPSTTERVWAFLTTPALTARYLKGVELVSDWNVGSRVELQGTDRVFVIGEVISLAPRSSLVYFWEQGVGQRLFVSWNLRAGCNGTVVSLTVDECDGDSEADAEDTWLPLLSALQSELISAT
jgi:uncharacterized protein YndB with AHSA1/START domain